MQTAGELYELYDQIAEWNALRLPLMVKIELEEVLPDVGMSHDTHSMLTVTNISHK